MTAVREDRKTSGSWGDVYGRDGYVLFDYDGPGKDLRRLPSYVASVEVSQRKNGWARHAQPAPSTEEPRASAPSPKNESSRRVGCIHTGDPIACQQTMSVDLLVNEGARYEVALYCLDWERQDRRQAIEVFDQKTLSRLAPVHAIGDFAEGAYLVYRCDRSVRFRINQVRGPNAVLNAIFFDRGKS